MKAGNNIILMTVFYQNKSISSIKKNTCFNARMIKKKCHLFFNNIVGHVKMDFVYLHCYVLQSIVSTTNLNKYIPKRLYKCSYPVFLDASCIRCVDNVNKSQCLREIVQNFGRHFVTFPNTWGVHDCGIFLEICRQNDKFSLTVSQMIPC